MKHEDQNKAIAELCGHNYHKPSEEEVKSGSYYQYEPDYAGDLNTMHLAETETFFPPPKLNPTDGKHPYWRYQFELSKATMAGDDKHGPLSIICATAAQRAEAFLKTFGKWKD